MVPRVHGVGIPHRQAGVIGEEPEVPHAASHVMVRLRDRLAHVARVRHGELVGVLLHEIGKPVDDRLPLLEAHPRPRPLVERPPRGLDRTIGIRLAAVGDGCLWFSGEGVDVVHRRAVDRRHFLPVDDVAVEVHGSPFR